jgi:hypothetical protein
MDGWTVLSCTEAPPLVLAPLAKKGKWGAKASRKTSTPRAARSRSVRGRGQKSAKAVAERVLANVEEGAYDELVLVIRRSFKDGRYSPANGME